VKLAITLLISSTCLAQLPDAPSTTLHTEIHTQVSASSLKQKEPCRGLSEERSAYGVYNPETGIYERNEQLHTCPVWTKKFIAAHVAFLGALAYDIEVTHQGLARHKCPEGDLAAGLGSHPGRSALYRDDLLEQFLPITAWDFLMAKLKPPRPFFWLPYMGATAGVSSHVRAGTEWFTGGCW
jgi:hypothetical protein